MPSDTLETSSRRTCLLSPRRSLKRAQGVALPIGPSSVSATPLGVVPCEKVRLPFLDFDSLHIQGTRSGIQSRAVLRLGAAGSRHRPGSDRRRNGLGGWLGCCETSHRAPRRCSHAEECLGFEVCAPLSTGVILIQSFSPGQRYWNRSRKLPSLLPGTHFRWNCMSNVSSGRTRKLGKRS